MDGNFTCEVNAPVQRSMLTVRYGAVATAGFASTDQLLADLAARPEYRTIKADGTGGGYVASTGDRSVQGWWSCRDLVLSVTFDPPDHGSRDAIADVSNFVASMLPWACEGQPAPGEIGRA